MQGSFQQEIPKARVNITLDVEGAQGMQQKELPLKLLALGDFSAGQAAGSVESRERIAVDPACFDDVIRDLQPVLPLTIGGESIALKFERLADFHPEHLTMQVPRLKRLRAIRNLLNLLKAMLSDHRDLRSELELLLQDKQQVQTLALELQAAEEGVQ